MFASIFLDISPTNRVWKNPRSAFKRARNELHNETNDHIDWQIFGGRYCETPRFFTSCLFYSLPYSLFCKSIDFPLPTILPHYSEQENLTKDPLGIQVLMFDSVLPISHNKSSMKKKPRSAFKRARKELHNETIDHIHWQIFGGRYCKTRHFFTSCLFYSLPYCLLCKCIEFSLPTILPPYPEQENLTKYSLSSQVLMFGSILPISLQLIKYEKNPRSAFKRAR